MARANMLSGRGSSGGRGVSLVPLLAGVIVIALGSLVLVGWALGSGLLKSVAPGLPSMKANTALALLCTGFAVLGLRPGTRPATRRVACSLGWVVATFGLVVIVEYVLGGVGIDQALVRDAAGAHPGRPSPHTALALMALGSALATVDARGHWRRVHFALLAMSATVVVFGAVGYVYGVDYLRGVSGVSGVAVHTLLALVLLTVAVPCLRPDDGLAAWLRGDDAGARMARGLLPVVVAGPLVLGSLRFGAQQLGWIGLRVGLSAYTLSMIFMLAILVVLVARRLRDADLDLRRLAASVEASDDAMINMTVGGVILSWNRAAERMYGYSASDIVGRQISFLAPPDRPDEIPALLERVRSGAVQRVETERLCRDGTRLDVALTISPIRDATGRVVGASTTARDITERKRADEALRQAQSRLRAIFDHVPAGLTLRGLDGRYIQVNNYVADALRTPTEELSGQHPAGHLDPKTVEQVHALDQELVRLRKPVIQEVSVPHADGTAHDYHVVNYPVLDEHGIVTALGSFSVDITERKHAERALERACEELDEAQRIARIGSWSWDTSADEALWSPEMYRIFARDPADGSATSEEFFAYVHPEDRDRLAAGYAETFGGGESFELDYRITAGDGVCRTLHGLGRRDPATSGAYIGTVQDVSELRQAEGEARRGRDYAAAITRSMREGVLLTRDGIILDVNEALCAMTGFSRDELIGASVPYPFWAPGSAEQIQAHRKMIRDGHSQELETEYVAKNGVRVQVSINTVAAHPAGGELLGYVSMIRDIADQKRHREALEHFATRDSLTGLLNHRVFHEQLRVEIARAQRHDRPLSVVLLDLDHFKGINDRHGHPAGDKILRAAAGRLQQLLRPEDHLARVGGEEFAWILPDATSTGAFAAAERARHVIAVDPFPGVGAVTLSAGVCQLADAGDAERLYALADEALYQAKQRGRNQTHCHDPDSDNALADQLISRAIMEKM